MQKYQDKNIKTPMEIPSAPILEKNAEICKKDPQNKKIEAYEKLFTSDEELEKIEEIEENDDENDDDNEKTGDNDDNDFWEQVDIVPCLPDADSSGSDSEVYNEIGDDGERAEGNVVESVVMTPIVTSVDLEKKFKIVRNERFLNNRNSSVPRNEQALAVSWNKKVNESLVLQTFRFPETEVEVRKTKHFEPVRASIGVRTYRHRVSKSLNAGKNSLRFLPALNSFSKSGDTKKMPTLMSFQGMAEQISKIVSFGNSFQHRK
jgi:hypothetical protein